MATVLNHVTAKHLDGNRWTRREARQFVKDAKWDMNFDGFDMELDFTSEGHTLSAHCKEIGGGGTG
jgi:hypothetical protein